MSTHVNVVKIASDTKVPPEEIKLILGISRKTQKKELSEVNTPQELEMLVKNENSLPETKKKAFEKWLKIANTLKELEKLFRVISKKSNHFGSFPESYKIRLKISKKWLKKATTPEEITLFTDVDKKTDPPHFNEKTYHEHGDGKSLQSKAIKKSKRTCLDIISKANTTEELEKLHERLPDWDGHKKMIRKKWLKALSSKDEIISFIIKMDGISGIMEIRGVKEVKEKAIKKIAAFYPE